MAENTTKVEGTSESQHSNNAVLAAVEKQFLAVFVDGEYKQILIVKAQSLEEAEQKLFDADWKYPVRLEEVEFDNDIAVIFNGS